MYIAFLNNALNICGGKAKNDEGVCYALKLTYFLDCKLGNHVYGN